MMMKKMDGPLADCQETSLKDIFRPKLAISIEFDLQDTHLSIKDRRGSTARLVET
jgi:hypothetical protein